MHWAGWALIGIAVAVVVVGVVAAVRVRRARRDHADRRAAAEARMAEWDRRRAETQRREQVEELVSATPPSGMRYAGRPERLAPRVMAQDAARLRAAAARRDAIDNLYLYDTPASAVDSLADVPHPREPETDAPSLPSTAPDPNPTSSTTTPDASPSGASSTPDPAPSPAPTYEPSPLFDPGPSTPSSTDSGSYGGGWSS